MGKFKIGGLIGIPLCMVLLSCQPKSDLWPYQYNDWTASNLKGRVKSIVKKAYGPSDSEKQIKEEGHLFGHEEKHFNHDGFMTKDMVFRSELTETGCSIFRFNAEKHEIIAQQHKLNGQKTEKTVSQIDNKGQTTEMKAYDNEGQFDYRQLYSYNKNGLLGNASEIKSFSGSPNHWVTTDKYVYDRQGFLIEDSLLDKEGIRHHNFFHYDKKGHLIRLIRRGYDGKVADTLTYRYRFDSTGNWTEKKIYKYEELNAIIKRVIVYY